MERKRTLAEEVAALNKALENLMRELGMFKLLGWLDAGLQRFLRK